MEAALVAWPFRDRYHRAMMSMPRQSFAPVFSASTLLVATWLSACGGDQNTTQGGGGSGATGAEGGAAGGFITGGNSGGTGIDENAACATSAVEGKTLPVTMLMMFDKSGSMLDDQKWFGAKAALKAFFQSDSSAGLSVGLRFFPDDEPVAGCNDQGCSVDACSVPLVPPAPLTTAPAGSDPQQKALIDALDSKTPKGETPMYPALGGAEKWAKENAKEGESRTVVVLITDGEPTTCITDVDAIATLAKDAHDQKGVLTYAIGMPGSNQTQLDKIAIAGGTEKAFLAPAGTLTSELIEALGKIQKAQIACSYDLPTPMQAGDVVDPGKVNVNYYDGTGSFTTMPKVSSISACSGAYEWYYDNETTPKTIELCPATCAQLQGNVSALVKILLGCETILK